MRARIRTTALATGAIAAIVGAGLGAAAVTTVLQEGAGDEELIDRLVAVERDLPSLPPEAVDIDPDQTWAQFSGDFTGARVGLETVVDEARALFIAAEESEGPVADAVADAARSIVVLHEAYGLLAEWETHDLAFPLDSFDEDGVATGADETYGLAQTGLSLLLDARDRALPAYSILRDAEAADGDERAFLDARYQAALAFDAQVKPDIHLALSFESTQVMRTVTRFVSAVPGAEPRARTMRVVCIDREAYETAELLTDDAALAALVTDPADDCPALDNGNEVRLVER